MLGVLTPAPVCVTFGVCSSVFSSSASHRKYTEENVSKGRERERDEGKPRFTHKRKPNTNSVVLSGKQALVYRHPLATRTCSSPFYRPAQAEADIRLRIVRLFVFAKCFLFESISM